MMSKKMETIMQFGFVIAVAFYGFAAIDFVCGMMHEAYGWRNIDRAAGISMAIAAVMIWIVLKLLKKIAEDYVEEWE